MATCLFSPLLPLHGLAVTLNFNASAEFSFFHQMSVDAFTRFMLNSPEDYKHSLTTEAPESGRLQYNAGDTYRFSIMGYAGKKHHFQSLISRLLALPDAAPIKDKGVPLRDNLTCEQIVDLIDAKPIANAQGLNPFTSRNLIEMAHQWQNDSTSYPRKLHLQWLSPTRLMRSSDERKMLKLEGEHRFCRDKTHVTPALVVQRIIESLNTLIGELGQEPTRIDPEIYQGLALELTHADLFWLDTPYYSKDKEDNTAGGMVGTITLTQTAPIPHGIWQGLILGQYLGIGQRRTSGFGKYQLTLAAPTVRANPLSLRTHRAQSLLSHALHKFRFILAIAWAITKVQFGSVTPSTTATKTGLCKCNISTTTRLP
jgi:hypothetical protein